MIAEELFKKVVNPIEISKGMYTTLIIVHASISPIVARFIFNDIRHLWMHDLEIIDHNPVRLVIRINGIPSDRDLAIITTELRSVT